MHQGKDNSTTCELSSRAAELAHEQVYVTMLYEHLDARRAAVTRRLTDVHRGPTDETHQAAYERDSYRGIYADETARIDAVEHGLCFGRLNFDDDTRLYIGRIGLHDDDYEPILVDWRAPAAVPFYRATPVERLGVVLRRHLHTKHRHVIAIDDDVLDLKSLDRSAIPHLTGEAALLASLEHGRSGRMSDIVATIQAEQDRVIRSHLKGILVVEGGPGTGKTVVALHRAAYLLYTYRKQLEKRGVLVIGPSTAFVRYIDRVIPSLGETEVVLATIGSLFPGVQPTVTGPPEAARLKGDACMVEVVANAVRNRQRVPDQPVSVHIDNEKYVVDPELIARARDRARAVRDPMHGGPHSHNRQRPMFVRALIDGLTQLALDRHVALREAAAVAELRAEIRATPDVHRLVETCWPELTPERLISELFADPEQLAAAAPRLSDAERAVLLREPDRGRSAADVPLLDEAAELLGSLDAELYAAAHGDAMAAATREDDHRFAVEVINHLRDNEAINIVDDDDVPIFAHHVVDTYAAESPTRPLAERAPEDREWTYGHVIVDEAQELSAMDWRMLMRRCPARSMTVVGDPAQRSATGGSPSWHDALDTYAKGRWRTERLTLNYRTPSAIMAVAADLLAATQPGLMPPRSVRDTADEPWAYAAPSSHPVAEVAELVAAEQDAIKAGKIAVIVPETATDLRAALLAAIPDAQTRGPGMLDAPVVVTTPRESKGLEFDVVVIVDPVRILAESPRGHSDLYVALTRATGRLGVVHVGPLPDALGRLRPIVGTSPAAATG